MRASITVRQKQALTLSQIYSRLYSMTLKLLAAGFAVTVATLGIFLICMFNWPSYSNSGQSVSAQVASSYCDTASNICFQGYTVRPDYVLTTWHMMLDRPRRTSRRT